MENEIKKLIEKYSKEHNEVPPFSAIPTWIVIRDLQSLLEFKKENCCGSIMDKLADAYAEGYQQCKEDLEGSLRISLSPEIINSQGIEKIYDKYGNEL